MSKIKDKIAGIKEKAETKKVERAAKKEAGKSFREHQQAEENRLIKILEQTNPASKEYAAIAEQLAKLSLVHANDRVSADNVLGAITSLGGLTTGIAYNERHNLPREAANFIRKPGKEPRRIKTEG